MKKILSVMLAVLMTLLCMAPAFAEEASSHNVTFTPPEQLSLVVDRFSYGIDADAFSYVKFENGKFASYYLDTAAAGKDYGYVYFNETDKCQGVPETNDAGEYVEGKNGKFYLFSDILFDDDKAKFDDTRYMPTFYEGTQSFEDGTQLSFFVNTTSKYDMASVVVTANGVPLDRKADGEFVVTVDKDLVIDVVECEDGNTARPVLLPAHFTMSLVSGDGYSVKTRKNENNRYVYYGDTFRFRVKIAGGFSGTDMKVKAVAGGNDLSEFLGEDADMLTNIMDKSEPLKCLGQDEDGCYLYETGVITADTRIVVSGVKETSKSGVLAKLKRILRLILDFFGIHLGFLEDDDGLLAMYHVTIDASELSPEFDYKVIASATDDEHASAVSVMNGEGVAIQVSYTSDRALASDSPNVVTEANGTVHPAVSVTWQIGTNPAESGYTPNWTSSFNRYSGDYTYTANYYIDGINADTVITIK